MLKIEETEQALMQCLSEAKLDLHRLDLAKTWEVFKTFARQPVDTQSDGILLEYGTALLPMRLANQTQIYADVFVFTFTRQFQAQGAEDYDQLRCQFTFEASAKLTDYGQFSEGCFAEAGCSREAFFAKIEALPVFEAVTHTFFPIRTEVIHEQA